MRLLRVFFTCFLISATLFAQEADFSKSVKAEDLREELAVLLDKPSLSQKKQYNDLSLLWEKVAGNLKDLFKEVPDGSSEDYDSEMNGWQSKVATEFTFLRKVSGERKKVLKQLVDRGESIFQTDEKTLERMGLELSIIPYKFLAYFYEKAQWLRGNLEQGVSGLFTLFLELFILFAICLVPFLFIRASRSVEKKIEEQKKKAFYRSFKSRYHRNLANFLPMLSEYLPWIFTYFALIGVEQLLGWSEFQEFSGFLPYLYYYVYYKVFRVTLELILREFVSKITNASSADLNQKIQSTSKFLGLVLLVIFSIKTAFLTILGHSLIFSLIEPFFFLLVLGLLFYVSAKWELEIEEYLRGTNIKFFRQYSVKRVL